jgi:hypothetical protein
MAQNFLGCDRDQELWLPPSLREWLPANHLAWFVIDAVESMDLAAFYAVYRTDGHGSPAHEPWMLALLLYCYASGAALAAHRAALDRGHRGPRDLRQPSGRSHDDRPVPSAPRAPVGRP